MARPRSSNKHLPKYVTVIHGSYWYRAPKRKPQRLAAVGEEAEMYRKLAGLMIPEDPGALTTVRACLDRYEREVVPTLAPRTQKDYHRHLNTLRASFGELHPNELKPRDVGRFLDVSKGKIQRNRVVAVLSAVYSKMVGRWYVADTNPCLKVERNESHKRTRYITDAEYLAVYSLMPTRVQIAMDLALITGQRQGDLLSLKNEQIHEKGIDFKQGKTGKKITIPFVPPTDAEPNPYDPLRMTIDRANALLPMIPKTYVIRTMPRKAFREGQKPKGGQPYTCEGFRAIWQRGMAKALKRGVIKERFTFHDIRAKCVSDSASLEDAMTRAGHQSMTMTRSVYDRGTRVASQGKLPQLATPLPRKKQDGAA
jgi:integrase